MATSHTRRYGREPITTKMPTWNHSTDGCETNGDIMESAREIAATKFEHLQLSTRLAIYRRSHVEWAMTPWAMLWSCKSGPSAVRSSSISTVHLRPTKNYFRARICRL